MRLNALIVKSPYAAEMVSCCDNVLAFIPLSEPETYLILSSSDGLHLTKPFDGKGVTHISGIDDNMEVRGILANLTMRGKP